MSIPVGLLWVVAAYLTGHVIAHLSGYLLEDLVVRHWFETVDAPILFRTGDPKRWERLFPGFFRSLPEATRERVLAAAGERKAPTAGRALFLHCFAIVKQDAVALTRMNAFLNQYGFCRNMCLIGIIAAVLFATRGFVTRAPLAPNYAGVTSLAVCLSLGIAVVMFYRYLKFYRLYSHELFTAYAEAKPAETKPAKPTA